MLREEEAGAGQEGEMARGEEESGGEYESAPCGANGRASNGGCCNPLPTPFHASCDHHCYPPQQQHHQPNTTNQADDQEIESGSSSNTC